MGDPEKVLPEGKLPKRTDGMSGTEIQRSSSYFRPWHKKIARLYVLRGMRPSQIANELGMSASYISLMLRENPMMRAEVVRLEKLLEDRLIEAEVDDFIKEEFTGMIPDALAIIRENIGDIHAGIDGKADRQQRTKDAWAIIERVAPSKSGGDSAVNLQLNLSQVIADNRGKGPEEVITSLTTHIREKKALQKGK